MGSCPATLKASTRRTSEVEIRRCVCEGARKGCRFQGWRLPCVNASGPGVCLCPHAISAHTW
eukprot:132998-Chlamydomonas_euryale.AAC.2